MTSFCFTGHPCTDNSKRAHAHTTPRTHSSLNESRYSIRVRIRARACDVTEPTTRSAVERPALVCVGNSTHAGAGDVDGQCAAI
eukprot:5365112-Pyramimonas_sp.AAC.1